MNGTATLSPRQSISWVPMTMILVLVLVCLVGSALLGFRGYWS